MGPILLLLLAAIAVAVPARAAEPSASGVPPPIVAAEAVYGDVARQIAGPAAAVTVILSNPAQDPHLFEAGPDVARSLSTAAIAIYNGAGYDPWMRGLLAATAGQLRGEARRVIDVADLLHVGGGANPHLWYDPATMPVVAVAIEHALAAADPAGAAGYAQRLAVLQAGLAGLAGRIATLRRAVAGRSVTATEPVYGPMLAALGLDDRNQAFQRAAMNAAEPSAAEIAGIETDLRERRVRALIRNAQTDTPAADRLVALANAAHIPVVTVAETLPAGMHYQDFIARSLDRLAAALVPR